MTHAQRTSTSTWVAIIAACFLGMFAILFAEPAKSDTWYAQVLMGDTIGPKSGNYAWEDNGELGFSGSFGYMWKPFWKNLRVVTEISHVSQGWHLKTFAGPDAESSNTFVGIGLRAEWK